MKNTDCFLVNEDDTAALSLAKKIADAYNPGAIIRITNAEMKAFNAGNIKVIEHVSKLVTIDADILKEDKS